MIGIPVGLAAANVFEWGFHKYVLHGFGKKKDSFWHFHWRHHKKARKNAFQDEDYEKSLLGWHDQSKEALALLVGCAMVSSLTPVAPFFVGTIWYSAYNYYRCHKRSHLDPEWAREHLRHHVVHHMGKDQDLNFCVTRPWFDHIMGTSTTE